MCMPCTFKYAMLLHSSYSRVTQFSVISPHFLTEMKRLRRKMNFCSQKWKVYKQMSSKVLAKFEHTVFELALVLITIIFA